MKGSLLIRDKIVCELKNIKTLPGASKSRKPLPNGLFGNNVIYSPLSVLTHL